jgi:hypothetical protein
MAKPSYYPRIASANTPAQGDIESGIRLNGYPFKAMIPYTEYNAILNEIDKWIEYLDSVSNVNISKIGSFSGSMTDGIIPLPSGKFGSDVIFSGHLNTSIMCFPIGYYNTVTNVSVFGHIGASDSNLHIAYSDAGELQDLNGMSYKINFTVL